MINIQIFLYTYHTRVKMKTQINSNKHYLFSYGTLQLDRVQIETYGRLLEGVKDSLLNYKLDKNYYVKVSGCGMNMLFATNYYLIQTFKSMNIISESEADILAQKINWEGHKMKRDYKKELEKRELKKETKKRDLRRKAKNGYFDKID